MYSSKQRDEYDTLYEDDDSRNYEELDENEDPDEAIEKLRGTIGRGDCVYCGAKNGMEYKGNVCFICNRCGKSVHEDIYYRWAAGYPINLNE